MEWPEHREQLTHWLVERLADGASQAIDRDIARLLGAVEHNQFVIDALEKALARLRQEESNAAQ